MKRIWYHVPAMNFYLQSLIYIRNKRLTRNGYADLSRKHKKIPWSESGSELHRPTFADKGCHVVSVTDLYGRILGFLDRSRYFSIK
jgi:hypothetical protein